MKAKYFIALFFVVYGTIFYGQDFSVEIKLKQEVKDFSLQNDKPLKSVSQKHAGLEFIII